MINNGMKRTKILLYILTLGFITPIGIIVGMVLTLDSSDSASDPTQSVAVGVLQVGQIQVVVFIPTTPSASPRPGTWLTRPDSRPQMEGTPYWLPVQQVSRAILHWSLSATTLYQLY